MVHGVEGHLFGAPRQVAGCSDAGPLRLGMHLLYITWLEGWRDQKRPKDTLWVGRLFFIFELSLLPLLSWWADWWVKVQKRFLQPATYSSYWLRRHLLSSAKDSTLGGVSLWCSCPKNCHCMGWRNTRESKKLLVWAWQTKKPKRLVDWCAGMKSYHCPTLTRDHWDNFQDFMKFVIWVALSASRDGRLGPLHGKMPQGPANGLI